MNRSRRSRPRARPGCWFASPRGAGATAARGQWRRRGTLAMNRLIPACASCTVMRNSGNLLAGARARQPRRPGLRLGGSLRRRRPSAAKKATAAPMRRPPHIGNGRETASRRGPVGSGPGGSSATGLSPSMTMRNRTRPRRQRDTGAGRPSRSSRRATASPAPIGATGACARSRDIGQAAAPSVARVAPPFWLNVIVTSP